MCEIFYFPCLSYFLFYFFLCIISCIWVILRNKKKRLFSPKTTWYQSTLNPISFFCDIVSGCLPPGSLQRVGIFSALYLCSSQLPSSSAWVPSVAPLLCSSQFICFTGNCLRWQLYLGFLVSLTTGKKTIGWKWVFTVKVNPNGSIAWLKAYLVAKGYAQTYGVDYADTFSPLARMASVRLFISLASINPWPFFFSNINFDANLMGLLQESLHYKRPH